MRRDWSAQGWMEWLSSMHERVHIARQCAAGSAEVNDHAVIEQTVLDDISRSLEMSSMTYFGHTSESDALSAAVWDQATGAVLWRTCATVCCTTYS